MISAFQDATWQTIAWTALVFLAGFVIGRRSGGGRDLAAPPRIGAPAPPAPRRTPSLAGPDPATRARIEAALAAGQKIEAIKLLREATGLGLKEAKEAIDDGRF